MIAAEESAAYEERVAEEVATKKTSDPAAVSPRR
jgi:hypothetical protein